MGGAVGSPPHAWGILAQSRIVALCPPGSPPHAWGIRPFIIPVADIEAVHPHTRGEYRKLHDIPGGGRRFTPTRVGNTPGRPARLLRRTRFTPTRVGNTPHSHRGRQRRQRFTPTRVGNTSHRGFSMPCPAGSPPHAWGIRLLPKGKGGGKRFTPTRVGNTARKSAEYVASTVHPHTRGEYACRYSIGHCQIRFTPTRVGNTSVCHELHPGSLRFTPTRVGNTPQPRR